MVVFSHLVVKVVVWRYLHCTPVIRMRKFETGVIVVQSLSQNEETVIRDTSELVCHVHLQNIASHFYVHKHITNTCI